MECFGKMTEKFNADNLHRLKSQSCYFYQFSVLIFIMPPKKRQRKQRGQAARGTKTRSRESMASQQAVK